MFKLTSNWIVKYMLRVAKLSAYKQTCTLHITWKFVIFSDLREPSAVEHGGAAWPGAGSPELRTDIRNRFYRSGEIIRASTELPCSQSNRSSSSHKYSSDLGETVEHDLHSHGGRSERYRKQYRSHRRVSRRKREQRCRQSGHREKFHAAVNQRRSWRREDSKYCNEEGQ